MSDSLSKGAYRSAESAAKAIVEAEWGTLNWLANAALTGSHGVTLGRVVIRTGKSNPRHRHVNCDEVLYLLRGKLEHSIGDDTVSMEPGDTINIPARVFHNAVSTGDEDAEMIVAYSTGERDFELEESDR